MQATSEGKCCPNNSDMSSEDGVELRGNRICVGSMGRGSMGTVNMGRVAMRRIRIGKAIKSSSIIRVALRKTG